MSSPKITNPSSKGTLVHMRCMNASNLS